MNTETPGSFDALVQGKIDGDTAFQESIAALSDEERTNAIASKRTEIVEAEFTRLRKADELATNYKIRAEKAEKALKGEEPEPPAPASQPDKSDLTTIDLYALQEAKVALADVEEVVKAAKLLDKSIPDALKDDTVLAIIKTRVEHRATAQAASVRPQRPSVSAPTDDQVLADVAAGKIPKPGTPEAETLFWARRGRKPK